jgi:hippurate hydrolase
MAGAYFGLGLGISSQLHYPDYDFNDEVLDTGVNLYTQIIKNINRSTNGI